MIETATFNGIEYVKLEDVKKFLPKESGIAGDVIEFLNQVTGSSYRKTSRATVSKINARANEGFELRDFKIVIAYKNHQWKDDLAMRPYLRPETLFGTKFESYLQDAKTQMKPSIRFQKVVI
jgi:uncharacterized phage protein (TIGR02220 family)